MILSTLALAAALLSPPQDSVNAGLAIASHAAQVYRGLSSFRADFVQVIDDAMLGPLTSKGRLLQSGTSKLSMRFTDPSGDALVMDGQALWVYTPSTTPGQVIKLPLPSGPTFGPNVLAWLLDDPVGRYQVSYIRGDYLDGSTVDVIGLVPIDKTLPFSRAVLWLGREDALPHRLELREKNGATRTLTLSRIRTNQPVTDQSFRFEIPGGVRVVER
ncbi:MAG TPA: outer membrane lipoprotein carrier protein LolA [Gemmatimonadales bacterium]|nr:outer membrane lipoprotein carrier protein LolA [Gemmatimonadales bacterium]